MVCGVVLTVLKASKSFGYDTLKEYLGCIASCAHNLGELHQSLVDVCNKKDYIKKKVKERNDKLEDITREAACWLNDARILTEDEELKGLMYKDIDTAKHVVKLMGKKYLKRRIREENEMQQLVLKVMKKLKEDVDNAEEGMRKILEDDYKQVAEVVVEVMRDTIDGFKKLMKEDRKMAAIVIRTLKGSDLDNLANGDEEIEKIVREARYSSDEELWPNRKDDESNALEPLLVKIPEMGVSENMVKDAIQKLFTPLASLVTPLVNLMGDDDFKKAVPHAADIKLGLQVIDGLFIRGGGAKNKMDSSTKQDNIGDGCCAPLSLFCYYCDRYRISKAAESMVKHIKKDLIDKCSRDEVTLAVRPQDYKPIPSQFSEGLESRTQLLHQILKKLIDDRVDSVGLFGMGGIGKSTLVKEVKIEAKDAFAIKVMVEISDAPDLVRIQATIAESIGLPLHNIHDVSQRAVRLHNQLSDVKKEKNVLIILDNVWKKLNLNEIGIPNTCKLLLTTRDKEVCRVMGVEDNNILEVSVMNTNEARVLFKSQAGNQVDAREYKDVVERLLSKCGGLPLAIVATANSLKDKNFSSWLKFADDLEKPILSQMSDDYHHTFTILNTSYKFIQPNGKRIFFLLASLFPLGSSASIESLLRYGIGLNLFERVNKLSEAMDKAVKWVDELTLSSMLLGGNGKGDVKIHDIVRDFAISYGAKEDEHEFIVEGIPRWLEDETLKIYTAMSLTSKEDYSRLSGVEVCKLQILILKGDLSPDFDDDFFSGMLNLKVLALSNMDFKPTLPGSMRKLKKLRTLCIEGCKLGNFELVGELVNLLVLSLRESSMEDIPNEIGNLHKLRLLDLSGCTSNTLPLISTTILNKLSALEGLYMYNEWESSVFEKKSEYEEANAIMNIKLPYLNALEIRDEDMKELPFDSQTIKNLDKFRIYLGKFPNNDFHNFCCSLYLWSMEDLSESLKVLFKKADYIKMCYSRNSEDVFPLLDQEGFRSLRSLELEHCSYVHYIVDGRKINNMIVFPCLQSLTLCSLGILEVCKGDVSRGSFSNLETINLSFLSIRYVLPLVPCNVKEINVSHCKSVEFMFLEDEQGLAIDLPFLKTLELESLNSLLSLVGPKEFSTSNKASQGPHFLFGGKIGLPSLESFQLTDCSYVDKLWSKEIHAPAFQNLKDIYIFYCLGLSSVGSASVFSNLVQLETLRISSCNQMHEVISNEEIEDSEIGELIFHQLKSLVLENSPSLKNFYSGRSKLKFPKLKMLILDELYSMEMFAMVENCSALFNEKIDFPCLEKLKVTTMGYVTRLWDSQSSATTSIRQLEMGSYAMRLEIPIIVLNNLSSVTITDVEGGDVIFSSSNLWEKSTSLWIYSELTNLKELKVENIGLLKELFEKEDYNVDADALTLFCGQFKTLELKELPSLNLIPLHLFKSIASLTLVELKWNYLISADALNSLQPLQYLSVEACPNMEALVINVGWQIELSSLRQLRLSSLDSFIGISSISNNEAALHLPSLKSLYISDCPKLTHFWTNSISAPLLEDMELSYCPDLEHFFINNSEDTIELPSLQKVKFSTCNTLESISIGSLTTPKLREVKLYSCNNMECLFQGNQNHSGDLQLPSLEVVSIIDCYNLHTFSLRRLAAPKLTQIDYGLKTYSMLPFDELNHFLKEHAPIRNSRKAVEFEKEDEVHED